MRPKTKTTILIPCSENPDVLNITGIAAPLAHVFDASLTFLIMKSDVSVAYLESESAGFFNKYKVPIRFISFPYTINNNQLMEKNHQDEEAVMVLFLSMPTGFFNRIQSLRFMLKIRKFRLPYMVLPTKHHENWLPETVIIPIGYDRTDKETAVWASYFARFSNSKIIVMEAKEDVQWAINSVNLNIKFVDRLFNKTNTHYEIEKTDVNSSNLPQKTLQLAETMGNSLIILSTTKHYGIGHYILGPDELRIINNGAGIPVLCVNPVNNAYVLCK